MIDKNTDCDEVIGLKERIQFNDDFKLDWHDTDELTDGYQLKWVGKDYARLQSGSKTETMIIPNVEHNSKNENKNSKNIYITGDNLEVLKHLQNSYSKAVKIIYIDPPYNTGSDGFVYNDKFSYTDEELMDMLGVGPEQMERLHSICGKKSHSAWLTFMYPRLRVARNLLTDDGVIFISIDDNEQANLKLLCDEIFGESNYLGCLIWRKKEGGGMADDYFATEHEYICVYSKSSNFKWEDEIIHATINDFPYKDNRGNYSLVKLAKWGNTARRADRPTMYFPIDRITVMCFQLHLTVLMVVGGWEKKKCLFLLITI